MKLTDLFMRAYSAIENLSPQNGDDPQEKAALLLTLVDIVYPLAEQINLLRAKLTYDDAQQAVDELIERLR